MREASGFDWDEGNRAKCQKHGLAVDDVEYVLAQQEATVRPVEGFEESRFIAIGLTQEDRFAFVVFHDP